MMGKMMAKRDYNKSIRTEMSLNAKILKRIELEQKCRQAPLSRNQLNKYEQFHMNLRDMVKGLTRDLSRVFQYKYEHGLTLNHIADELNISITTVKRLDLEIIEHIQIILDVACVQDIEQIKAN